MNTIDKILLACAIFILAFTITMIVIFCIFQSVPDTLVESVFTLFTGEAVITFVIWWIKKRHAKDKTTHACDKKEDKNA